MGRLRDRVAIITGGTGGIGRATAEAMIREGARVLLVDRDAVTVAAAARELGDACEGFAGDVSIEQTAKDYVAKAVSCFGGVDILVGNAGIEGRLAPLHEQTEADVDRVLGVNVKGVWFGLKHVVPAMIARGGGSVIMTSSVAGLIGSPGLGPYIASKHAVMGLMKTAAMELGPLGIRVNTVNPGPVDNRMMRSIEEQAAPGHAADVKAGFAAQVPLGRYATNEEIAACVVFLASDEASIVHGTSLVADGGFVTH